MMTLKNIEEYLNTSIQVANYYNGNSNHFSDSLYTVDKKKFYQGNNVVKSKN